MEKYSSGLVSESFWFVEFKKIIKLIDQGKTWEEIQYLCITQNILGLQKEYRTKRVYSYLHNRIKKIDKPLIEIFINSDLETQKIINLISIAMGNKLFLEFLYEVYREKRLFGIIELTDSDINIFFKNKQAQNEDVATWKDVTLKRLRSSYINFMADAGLIIITNKKREVSAKIIDIALEQYLKDKGYVQILKAITGEA